MAKGKGFAMSTDQGPCPCGGGQYESCCAPLHRGEQRVSTAEQLMRSRYAAFAKGELEYLLTTHPEADVPEAERRQQLLKRAEFKRRQAAPLLKMSPQAFGSGWRLPIACG